MIDKESILTVPLAIPVFVFGLGGFGVRASFHGCVRGSDNTHASHSSFDALLPSPGRFSYQDLG